MTYETLINKLRNDEKFSFSRWGDGEFNAIFQDTKSQRNCDGHTYFKDLGERLKSILSKQPPYFIGLQSLAYKQRKDQIDSLGLNWVESDIIHRQSLRSGIQDLIDILKEKNAVIVGNEKLKALGMRVIEIPEKDCWLQYGKIKDELNKLSGGIIIYCASMMSEVLIDDLHERFTQIDIGSAFDPYVGVKSRTYHNKLNI